MKLAIFSYKQPAAGNTLRFGAVSSVRDTRRDPIRHTRYRQNDSEFKRTRHLMTIRTTKGAKVFYGERVNWKIEIPVLGSLLGMVGILK